MQTLLCAVVLFAALGKQPHMHHNIGISESRDLHSKSSQPVRVNDGLGFAVLVFHTFHIPSPSISIELHKICINIFWTTEIWKPKMATKYSQIKYSER